MAKKQDRHPIKERYDKAVEVWKPQLRDYWSNRAFILDNRQWIWWSNTTDQLELVPEDTDHARPTINRLWPGSRTLMGKLLQRELTFENHPNDVDDRAIQGARLGESIIRAIHHDHRWEAMREKLSWAVWLGGTGALAVEWDPKAGKPVALSDVGVPIPQGDTVETALSLPEFIIEPYVQNVRQARWWIRVQALAPERVKFMYSLEKEPPADATFGLTSLQGSLMRGLAGASASSPLTLVLTYYERPNEETPAGQIVTIVDNKEVEGPKPWPFPFKDRLNLFLATETPVDDQALGRTVVTIARPIQSAYNVAWGAIMDHLDNVSNVRMAIPQSAIDIMDQVSDRPGEMLTFMDGMDKPSYIVPPNSPSDWWRIIETLSLQLDDELGVHDISRGAAPVNIESGYGLSVLAEQDSTPIGKMTKSIAFAFAEMASAVLQLYESEAKGAKRTSVVTTPDQMTRTVRWTGKDLAGQTTVVVPLDAVAPRSQAAMQAFAEKALQMGLIQTVQQFTRLSEIPGARDMIDAVAPDVARARRENHAMSLGQVRFPEDWDNHADHLAEHNAFRKSAAYETLGPKVKELFAVHVQAHETLAGAEAGKMSMRALEPGLAGAPNAQGALPVPPPDAGGLLPDQIAEAQAVGGVFKAGQAEQEILDRISAAAGLPQTSG